MTSRTTHIINSALRTFGASIDADTHRPVSSFPSGAKMAEWDRVAPKSSI